MSSFSILGIGGIYEDVMLTVPHFPHEDSKLRATSRKTRLGGNIPNTLGVLSQILIKEKEDNWRLFFMGALGDDESSVFLKSELEKGHIKPCILNRTDRRNPPTAYILESAATHTRTIISHNEVVDLSIPELRHLWHENICPVDKIGKNYPVLSWVHIEGRNCEVLFKVLEMITVPDTQSLIDNMKHNEMISVDFERPGRKGLRELFRFANVAFISKGYAISIAMQENTDRDNSQLLTNTDIVRGVLRNIGNELMKATLGYITVGSEGCYVFMAQKSVHVCAAVSRESGCWENGWLFFHLPASNDISSGGPVVETTGAGDTFIAAVIYGLGVLKLNPIQAGKLGNTVAGRKCLQEGYHGVWKGVETASY